MTKKAKKTTRRRSTSVRSRDLIKAALASALRDEFPEDTVDISDGYRENIHVMVVSRLFDGMQEQQKHDLIWQVIDRTDLTKQEKILISLVMPVSPAEIR